QPGFRNVGGHIGVRLRDADPPRRHAGLEQRRGASGRRRPHPSDHPARTIAGLPTNRHCVHHRCLLLRSSLRDVVPGTRLDLAEQGRGVLLTEVVFAPVFLLGVFVVFGVLKQQSLDDIKGTVRDKYAATLAANLVFSPATQIINFRFVPLNYHLLFADFMGLLWSSFLSWRANSRYVAGHER
ncbi:unnamed protein product, partial [Ixodes hexagonus]